MSTKTSHIDIKTLATNPNWVIFTAQNPTNRSFTTALKNRRLHLDLVEELENGPYRHTFIEVHGSYAGKQEQAVLVWSNTPIDRKQAASIARHHNQECVLTADGLTYQNGNLRPVIDVSYPLTQPEDNYTLIGSHYVRFNINFEDVVTSEK
jgi:hypothetical protein